MKRICLLVILAVAVIASSALAAPLQKGKQPQQQQHEGKQPKQPKQPGVRRQQRDQEEARAAAEIEAVKRELLSGAGRTDHETASLWTQLGIHYQTHDMKWHDGGTMQPLALEAFEKALSLTNERPLRYLVHQRMGMLLKVMGRGEESINAHDVAFDLATDDLERADALNQKAHTLGMLNRVPQSIEVMEQSIEIYPKAISSYLPLVKAHRELKDLDADGWRALVARIKTAIKKHSGRSKIDQAVTSLGPDIYWAAFEALDALKEHKEAWRFLELAHRVALQTRERASEVEDIEEQLEQVKTVFKPGFFPEPSIGSDSKLPVFIIGMMRSGSTLTETMLDAHPEVFGMGEDSVFNSGLAGMRDRLVAAFSDAASGMEGAKQVLQEYAAEVNQKMIEQSLLNARNTTPIPVPKRIVDKMLFNYRNVGFIHLTYPKAVILHTIRDPMDTLLSCYRHKFDDRGLDWSLDPERLVTQYVIYLKLVDHFRKLLPGRIIDVSYEALVSDPEAVLRPVVKRLGLQWSDDIMTFYKTNRTVQTHSVGQVRHGISRSAVGIWRNYKKQMKPIINLLKPHLKALKYSRGLPFPEFINWELDPDFDYDAQAKVSISDLVAGRKVSVASKKAASRDEGTGEDGNDEEGGRTKKKGDKASKKSTSKSKRRSSKEKKTKKRKSKRSTAKRSSGRDESTSTRSKRRQVREVKEKADSRAQSKTAAADLKTLYQKWQTFYKSSRGSGAPNYDVVQIRRQLPLPSGDSQIDELISLAYALYLSNLAADAAKLLQEVESAVAKKEIPGLYLGMVQALASQDRMVDAIKYADRLIRVRPEYEDIYGAKSQMLASLGKFDEAIDFLNYHIKQKKVDADLLMIQRGMVYFKMQKFRSAYKDFTSVCRKDKEAQVLAMIGKCEKEFGETTAAVKSLKRALELEPSKADTYLDLAIVLMEVGDISDALKYLNKSIEFDPQVKSTWGYAGLLYQTLGEAKKCIYYFEETSKIDPYEHTAILLSGMCYLAELQLGKALKKLNELLSFTGQRRAETHVEFVREAMYYRIAYIDTPFTDFNFDTKVFSWVKVGLHKGRTNEEMVLVKEDPNRAAIRKKAMEVISLDSGRPRAVPPQAALDAMKQMAFTKPWIQLDCPGFLPHTRQHRQFGLAVLEMAQALRAHVKAIQRGERGIFVSNAGSAFTSSPLHQADVSDHLVDAASGDVGGGVGGRSGEGQQHLFSYRDFLEIAVKWRQLAEPFDVVYWLDLYPPDAKMEHLALSTSLFSGLKRNARYYPYFNFTFEVCKKAMMERFYTSNDPTYPTESQKEEIEKASTLEDLFKIAQVSNVFFIVTETKSLARPGRSIPGTRIAITRVPPEGFDMSIGSPTNDQRFVLLGAEVKRSFNLLVEALVQNKSSDIIIDHALEFYFYWAQWGPLSRGTAATGYATILAVLLANGEVVTSRMPHMKQMDWEAILRSDPLAFRDAVRPWLSGRESAGAWVPPEWLDGAPGHRLSEIFRTPRDVMNALSWDT